MVRTLPTPAEHPVLIADRLAELAHTLRLAPHRSGPDGVDANAG
jgi:hypothetical protein